MELHTRDTLLWVREPGNAASIASLAGWQGYHRLMRGNGVWCV